jgi:hypothetical protein
MKGVVNINRKEFDPLLICKTVIRKGGSLQHSLFLISLYEQL